MTTPTFEITVNDETRTIKMYYGLLDAVCRACGEIDGALVIALEHDLREEVLNILLAERDETGKVKTPFNPMRSEIEPEAINDLLEWAGAHAMDFFLKAAERAKKTGLAEKDRMEALQST
tara:strand:+ start:4043 stop:4402 length:360 start_codon:yes stop_codon:yes gene_type:complete